VSDDIEIEDEEAVRLIRLLAEALGVSDEEAIEIAVRERLERLKARGTQDVGP
jgi:hypothetical protein